MFEPKIDLFWLNTKIKLIWVPISKMLWSNFMLIGFLIQIRHQILHRRKKWKYQNWWTKNIYILFKNIQNLVKLIQIFDEFHYFWLISTLFEEIPLFWLIWLDYYKFHYFKSDFNHKWMNFNPKLVEFNQNQMN